MKVRMIGNKYRLGYVVTEEQKLKIKKTMTGRKYSQERRQAMSDGWIKRRERLNGTG